MLHGYAPSLLDGALLTLALALSSLGLSLLLGLVVATAGLARSPLLRRLARGYTTLVRGVPDLVLMLLVPPTVARFVPDGDHSAGVHAMGYLVLALLPLTVLAIVRVVPERPARGDHAHKLRDMVGIFRIPLLRRLMLVDMLAAMALGLAGALLLFFFEAARGFDSADSSLLLLIYFVAGLCGAPFWIWLARRTSKHNALKWSLLVYAVFQSALLFLPAGGFAMTAAIMALAISAMHYTAMAGFHIVSLCEPDKIGAAPVLSQNLLAIIVAVVAFVVSGLFLLTLVPEGGLTTSAAEPAIAPAVQPHAANLQPAPDEARDMPAGANGDPVSSLHRILPVEKNGRRTNMPVWRLFAVQAQAHYTLLFDGETTWFCPLSISEVESILDSSTFARVHRSHIINLDRFTFVRRSSGDGMFEAVSDIPYKVPVARARRVWLKQQLQHRVSIAK